jgi:hypothetical protein
MAAVLTFVVAFAVLFMKRSVAEKGARVRFRMKKARHGRG